VRVGTHYFFCPRTPVCDFTAGVPWGCSFLLPFFVAWLYVGLFFFFPVLPFRFLAFNNSLGTPVYFLLLLLRSFFFSLSPTMVPSTPLIFIYWPSLLPYYLHCLLIVVIFSPASSFFKSVFLTRRAVLVPGGSATTFLTVLFPFPPQPLTACPPQNWVFCLILDGFVAFSIPGSRPLMWRHLAGWEICPLFSYTSFSSLSLHRNGLVFQVSRCFGFDFVLTSISLCTPSVHGMSHGRWPTNRLLRVLSFLCSGFFFLYPLSLLWRADEGFCPCDLCPDCAAYQLG